MEYTMAYSIVPIDMGAVLESNPNLDVGLLQLYKAYEVAEKDVAFLNTVPVRGKVTVNDSQYEVRWGVSPKHNGFKVTRIITVPHPDPVVNKWGDWQGDWEKKDGALWEWMYKKIGAYLNQSWHGEGNNIKFKDIEFPLRLWLFNPMQSEIACGKISVYQSRKDYDSDRQVAMKPGRAIKLMFDMLDDATVLEWVDEYLDVFAPRNYKLHFSKDAADFTKAYTGKRVATQNISHDYNHKSLANSCMRYKFRDGDGPMHLPVHPVEAYASGDFTIAWAEDGDGLIGGRVVVYNGSVGSAVQAGPIYGACNIAINLLENWVQSIEGEFAGHGDWEGAKLVAHEFGDDFIGPYLDIEPRNLEHRGEYLVICNDGEIDANSYQGVLSANGRSCSGCGCRVHEDDTHYSEYTGEDYCSDCYYDDHFFCEYTDEDCHVNESIIVYSITRHGEDTNRAHECVQADGSAILCKDGKIWDADDVVYCEEEDEWLSPNDLEDYFTSDWDGEWYPASKACVTDDGEVVSKQELDDHDDTWVEIAGVYNKLDTESEDEVCNCELCKE